MTSTSRRQRKWGRKWGLFSSLTTQQENSGTEHYYYKGIEKPYNEYPHAVAHFQRNEITTGVNLSLMNTPNFEFWNVTGIQPKDSTDVMVDLSTSDNNNNNDMEHHHRTFPEAKINNDEEEEQDRAIVQSQSGIVTGKTNKLPHRPLHKYMIKQVHPKSPYPEQARKHLAHEIKLWKRLSQYPHHHNNNLLNLVGTTLLVGGHGHEFLLTERISETLEQRLQRWRRKSPANSKSIWPSKKIVSTSQVDPSSREFRVKLGYAHDIASVLAFLHSQNIVVRNLSPESIGFAASDDALKVMDFGQATEATKNIGSSSAPEPSKSSLNSKLLLQHQEQQPLFQMTCGGNPHCFRYMAPELLAGNPSDKTCSRKVDSYSWAMIALEIITLHKPFGKMKAGQHLKQVVFREPSMRPHLEVYQLPRVIESLLEKAWRQDASRRYEAQQIEKRLQTILARGLHNERELHDMVIEFEDESERQSVESS